MRANRSRDTTPELRVRRALHALGLRYRVHWSLPFDRRRRADIAFTRHRVAVFIDGCFWHGCPEHYVPPSSNPGYWSAKVAGNRARDADTTARLEELGWTVLRAWEHEDVDAVVDRVAAAYRSSSPSLQAASRRSKVTTVALSSTAAAAISASGRSGPASA